MSLQDAFNEKLIYSAIARDSVATLKIILDSINQPDGLCTDGFFYDGNTEMHVAAEYGSCECLKELIARGKNVNICNDPGDTPLLIACQKNHTNFALLLLENGATANAMNQHRKTPLLFSVAYKNEALVQRLLDANADPCVTTVQGYSAWSMSTECPSIRGLLERYLLRHSVPQENQTTKNEEYILNL